MRGITLLTGLARASLFLFILYVPVLSIHPVKGQETFVSDTGIESDTLSTETTAEWNGDSKEASRSMDYRIGPEDVLNITILGRSDYKLIEEKTVSPTGRILLSIMQDEFEIAGLTVTDASRSLERILEQDYLNEPRVILEVSKFNSQKVLVIGEVKQPGEVTLQSATLSLKDLIIQTGGPVGVMDKTVIVVGPDLTEQDEPIAINLDELLLSNQHENVKVSAGDIIYILGRDKQLPIANLENTVYVFGQVGKPGIVPFSRNMTVLRAIINAGNFTSAAAPGRTSVKRYSGKKIETISVNMDRVMSGGDKSVDIELKPGDVIYVPRAIF